MEFLEPWRCFSCNDLMYNTDSKGYPTPGAPLGVGVEIEDTQRRLCMVCAQLCVIVLNNKYFVGLIKDFQKEQDHKKKLKSGSNYLDNK